jgi:hypothetical protein
MKRIFPGFRIACLVPACVVFLCPSAGAEKRVGDTPLYRTQAWQQGVERLRRYREGGEAPPPMRINGVSLAPGTKPALHYASSGRGGALPPAYASSLREMPNRRDAVRRAGEKYGVPEALLTAVLQVESNFNPLAVSPKGALGIMQIMPETGRDLGLTDFFDPEANLDAGTRYLASLLRTFARRDLALAAYNAGPGAVMKYGGVPPYPETRDYVARVLELYRKLQEPEEMPVSSARSGAPVFSRPGPPPR